MADFNSKEVNPNNNEVYDVSAEEVVDKLDQVKVFDVRRPDEFSGDLGHIDGAELLPLDTLNEAFTQIPKEETVVIVCRSGGRSLRATSFLIENGYTNIYNLKGGMISWNENNLPIKK